jgi:hypothetical protein
VLRAAAAAAAAAAAVEALYSLKITAMSQQL